MTTIGQTSPSTAPVRATGADERRLAAVLCLALAAITWAVFGQAAGFGFINYDDNLYVYDNPMVARGLTLQGIAWAFTYGDIGHWHPLTWLTHMADCQFYGLHPGGPHVTNVLLHTATVILLFLVLRQMTGALWRSAFVAAVFAIHPLRAESVAWIAERKDVLSGVFFMLTLGAYVRYARQPSRGRCVAVAVLYGLGLLCKNTLVTLPFVLLLLDWWPLRRMQPGTRWGALVREKIPLFLLAAASCVATALVPEKVLARQKAPFLARLGNAVVSYVTYLRQTVFPAELAIPYPYSPGGIAAWKIAGAVALLAVITGGVFACLRNRPWLLLGWLWYLGMLVPTIGFVQISYYAHADRYTYLPGIGLALAGTWAAADWSAGWKHRRVVLGTLMATVIGALMVCAWNQTAHWRDSQTLWTHTLACIPRNEAARHNLGSALMDQGKVDDAIVQYRLAVQIAPNNSRPRFTLASALLQKGKVDEALTQFMDALQIDPNDAEIHTAFGQALLQRGKVKEAAAHFLAALQINPGYAAAHFQLAGLLVDQGRVDDAITHYQQALRIAPDQAGYHSSLGSALLRQGRVEEAAAQFQQALELKPNFAQAHYNLGNILLQGGKTDDAISHYQRAVQIDPDYAQAHVNLGDALLQKGKVDEAAAHFQKALQIDSSNAPAHVNLGDILLQRGKVDEAMAHFQKALQFKPGFAEARAGLGDALRQKGKEAEAIAQFQQALQLEPDDPEIQNSLAWLLATSPEGLLRNGGKAVQLAQRASQLAGGRNPVILRTLAAAFAEAGRFDDARRSAHAAIELAQPARRQDLVAPLNAELKLYEAGLPFHR